MSSTTRFDKAYLTEQVAAFQKGDESAFGHIYQLIADKLLRYAMVMTKNRMEAEDLLQDTMVEVVKSIGKLRDPAAFTTWSVQIMRNSFSHKLRKKTDAVARDDSDLEVIDKIADEDEAYRPDMALENESVGTAVREEMNGLPEAQRTAMVAYYYDGMSVSEISDMMGASENTIKSRLFAGRKAMKRAIEKYEQRTGVQIHEFTPAPLIVIFMRTLFEGSGIDEADVLAEIFRKVVEDTGISASLPSDTFAPSEPEGDPDSMVDEGPEADEIEPDDEFAEVSEPEEYDFEPTPDETPETDAESVSDEMPEAYEIEPDDETLEMPESEEYDFEPAPDEVPETPEAYETEPDPEFTEVPEPDEYSMFDDAPDTPDAEPIPDEVPETPGSVASSGKAAASLGKAALLPKLIAVLLVLVVIVVLVIKFALPSSTPDQDPGLPGADNKNNDDYSKAYLSVLALYEDDIRDYTWQWKESYRDETPTKDPTPVALKDIDGDGVPELFFMAKSYAVYDEVEWLCSDLHIFTFKNDKLQELKYEYDYPNEYATDFYDKRAGQYIDHDERMVHFCTMEPNTSYVVFAGKTPGTLHILASNASSETWGFRLRKYSMGNDEKDTSLSIASDTYKISTGEYTEEFGLRSDNADAELKSGIDDMDEMVIYGGYGAGLGQSPDPLDDSAPDAEKNGWQNIQYVTDYNTNEGDVDISPEKFRNSLCITYDDAVEQLTALASKASGDDADVNDEYIDIRRNENVQQAGNRLFRFDTDSYVVKHVKLGETNVKTFEGGAFSGIGLPYTDGKSILYFDHADTSIKLVKYDFDTQNAETMHEYKEDGDPNSGYHIGAVYDGKVYIGFSNGEKVDLSTYDLDSGELADMKEKARILGQAGRYVITTAGDTLSADTVMQGDIYELNGKELKHVADLGNISVSIDTVDGRFYYSAYKGNDLKTVEVHRCDPDGSNDEMLASFLPYAGYDHILVQKYAENYCKVWFGSNLYKYIYKTKKDIPLEAPIM